MLCLLTKGLVVRQKIRSVVVLVHDGNEEASWVKNVMWVKALSKVLSQRACSHQTFWSLLPCPTCNVMCSFLLPQL